MSESVRVLSGGAAQGLVESVRGSFPHGIEGTFGAVGAMRDRLLKGEPADVMILSRALIDALAADGHVRADSVRDLGTVETAIAVRTGDVPPDVSGRDALRAALGAASAIHFPDPEQATAGIHFAKVMREFGVWDEAASRLRPAPNGATAMRALAADASPRPIGCTQATEILSTPGIVLVAPLPAGCELATVYTAAVTAKSAASAASRALIDRLATAPGKKRLGFI
jgi:molybdate transport system substrate-binding protein